jgi:hypothetical protein
MDYSKYIDLNSLSEKARMELENFYEYLVYKYETMKEKKPEQELGSIKFKTIQLDTIGFTFDREEANER